MFTGGEKARNIWTRDAPSLQLKFRLGNDVCQREIHRALEQSLPLIYLIRVCTCIHIYIYICCYYLRNNRRAMQKRMAETRQHHISMYVRSWKSLAHRVWVTYVAINRTIYYMQRLPISANARSGWCNARVTACIIDRWKCGYLGQCFGSTNCH